MTRGDLVETRLLATADGTAPATGTLEQAPEVEGAVLAIDNRTGQILAMVGGYSFERSKFNRATQAYRQVGSAFKPIVYTAAIDRGYTPVTLLMDTPVELPRRRRTAARTRRSTTTASSKAQSRCAAPSSSRATCPPCGSWISSGPTR